MNKLIIVGSSRTNGDTAALAHLLQTHSGWDLIDLNDYKISYYDYEHKNKEDDFFPLMQQIIEKYEVIVFATPVYWYSMSAIMKVFFDRITDLLDINKELGRRLRGKKMAAISSSAGDNLGEAFWLPFSETARYLGMKYIASLHTFVKEKQVSEEDWKALLKFIQLVNQAAE